MAGENGNGAGREAIEVQPAAELRIAMDRQGNVQVQGPIENRMLCYSMLEMARDAIFEHSQANRGDRRIVAAPMGMHKLL